ncbi:hypothetical protein STEG23_033701 [Scotinomys teguina]
MKKTRETRLSRKQYQKALEVNGAMLGEERMKMDEEMKGLCTEGDLSIAVWTTERREDSPCVNRELKKDSYESFLNMSVSNLSDPLSIGSLGPETTQPVRQGLWTLKLECLAVSSVKQEPEGPSYLAKFSGHLPMGPAGPVNTSFHQRVQKEIDYGQ